ncbi:MAG: NADH-quinone oxidoreductase subunit L [Candidatus Aminicenantes bacterium RBG_13_64_14]|nr:MAG: NADH-quinone oxidoreductase subunit L [Candidatus Aminicenantes bacterium RBG_13_64_14]
MFVLIPLFPLLGAAVNGLLGIRFFSRRAVGATAVGAVGLSFAAAVAALAGLLRSAEPVLVKTFFTWIPASVVRTAGGKAVPFALDFAFRYDSLAAVMTLVVTGVGLLIHVYSVGYMAHDRSYARFFAYMNLFTFAMLILVLGANLAVMFIGWEGVGLCSYLLIGFWFTKDAAADAGKKAFITNRVGDFGFLLGTGLLLFALGTIDIAGITAAVEGGGLATGTATAAALLLFLGATGKSAQIPLYTWLPDAMEGPTPVSALIHAATMVTAGVYMVARLHALFSFSGTALTVVALTGAITAVYAATMAFVQTDIKRVLAYSTISQIGYMFMGLGVGAYAAGIFHLMTHAFFKSLLFLAAGSVIHALSGEQDMRNMGGLRKRVPRTYLVFLVGALAISGIPGLSGFFSKDEILASAYASGHYLVWGLGLAGAAMTAFYMFRLIFLTFHGEERLAPDAGRHLHESPPVMLVPLQVLAGLAVVGGYVGLPRVLGGGAWFARFLETSTGAHESHLAAGTEVLLMIVSVGASLAAIYAAWTIYVKRRGEPARRLAGKFKTVYRVVSRKYFVDEAYSRIFVGGVIAAGRAADWFDRRVIDGLVDGAAGLARRVSRLTILFDDGVVDGAVNGVGRIHLAASSLLRRLQTGYVYNYALAVVLGAALIITLVITVF